MLSESELAASHSPNDEFATGGIVTKLKAAEFLMQKGRDMFLCSGFDLTTVHEYLLEDIHNKGTLFKSKS